MVTALPRLVVAAPSTGQGKTTIATGLMAALRRAGHEVSGHKVGPDYIDPGYHSLACGRPGRNLDPHLVGEERIVPLLLHGARGADVAVVEGVMGLYDGRVGHHGFSSTAHVASLTRSPVLLVVDVSRSSRSLGAVVHGMATYDPAVRVGGVILNQVGSPRMVREVTDSISLPVLGAVPRDQAVTAPSRHLGLVPAAERDEAAASLDRLAAVIADHVDLDAVLALARTADDLDADPWDPAAHVTSPDSSTRPVVAVAGGRAFTFRYAETEELLRAAGCEPVTFDPMNDTALPEGTRGIYLGGGFPEVHAAVLSDNTSLRQELRAAVDSGVPTVAECAGLLYLCRTLDGTPMVGVIPANAAMHERLTLRYPEARAASDNLLTREGDVVTGHEFHRTVVTSPGRRAPLDGRAESRPAWDIDGDVVGFAGDTLHASYLHTHWAGHPHLAQRFADAVHAFPGMVEVRRAPATSLDTPAPAKQTDPLRFHGDEELAPGLTDLAVNVFPGPPPPWLTQALRTGLERSGSYPDARPAERAVARHHDVDTDSVLATAGAAEAFALVATMRPWRRPVVVHPQFTEPQSALERAGHTVTEVHCEGPAFELDAEKVPEDADLVVVGNPTNPTGVLHSAAQLKSLAGPGRLLVVDEAFMDTVEDDVQSLVGIPGVLVLRSLTKHWGIPGVRAGYVVGDVDTIKDLREQQTPWSVSASAAEALVVCSTDAAAIESRRRRDLLVEWRRHLEKGLVELGVPHVPSATSFVLAQPGVGVHAALRRAGVAVRRCDTFPGLDDSWVRIAARPSEQADLLLTALIDLLDTHVTDKQGRPA